MKLLLTSGGITNQSISKALLDLVGKKAEETSLVFIPTAANVEMGDKSWFIEDLVNLSNQNFKSIDIADISALDEKIWKQKIEAADVLYFEGGDSYHLMEWINKSSLASLLPGLLKEKVFVGVSAGSMIASKNLNLKITQSIYGEDLNRSEELDGLRLVDIYILPHLNSPYFEKVREETIKEALQGVGDKVYALDDDSALKIDNNQVEVVSEGKWLVFNE